MKKREKKKEATIEPFRARGVHLRSKLPCEIWREVLSCGGAATLSRSTHVSGEFYVLVRSFVREICVGSFEDPAGRASLSTWAKGRDDSSRSMIRIVVSNAPVDVPLLRSILGDKIRECPSIFLRVPHYRAGPETWTNLE